MMKSQRALHIIISFLPIILLIGFLTYAIKVFGTDVSSGASQICLLAASAACVGVGMCLYRHKWEEFEKALYQKVGGVSTAIFILLSIGAISGSWMISGVVPTLMYYGIQVIHPQFFLVSTTIICAIVSVMTGSSWTTVATIGVALMGIGHAQGFSDGWIAGAIISGAYFGDKMSPLSDTTVIASSSTGTPLFVHIKYMLFTTVPSLCCALAIFAIAGFSHQVNDFTSIDVYLDALSGKFNITLWLLIVPLITGILIARKQPSLITLFTSAFVAILFALLFQPHLLAEISGDGSLCKGCFMTLYGPTHLDIGTPDLNRLIATKGMSGMMNTIWMLLCAMFFGATMETGGMLEGITTCFARFTGRRVPMVISTVCSGIFFVLATADQYLAIILTGNIFKKEYSHRGYESRLLSRTIEDSATVTSPLVPWAACGMAQSAVLGVPTLVYLPYSFFNLISPVMTIIVAATGYKIFRKESRDISPSPQDVR